MKNLTTPKAILFWLGLIALAIVSVPYSSRIVKPAFASNGIQRVVVCGINTVVGKCARVTELGDLLVFKLN